MYISSFIPQANGKKFLQVAPSALRLLSATAMRDIAHLLRPAHLQQLSNILKVTMISNPLAFHISILKS